MTYTPHPDGAQRDEKGRMLAPLPGNTTIRSSEQARAMSRKHWDSVRAKAAARITAEARAIDNTVNNAGDALALLHAKQYTVLMDTDKPVANQVIKLTEFITGKERDGREQAQVQPTAPHTISASPDTMMELLRLLEQDKAHAVAKATATDV